MMKRWLDRRIQVKVKGVFVLKYKKSSVLVFVGKKPVKRKRLQTCKRAQLLVKA